MRRSAKPWGWLAGLSLGLRLALGGLPAHAQPPALFSAVEADATAHAATPTAEADPTGPTILRQRLVALDSALLATARTTGQAQAATLPTLSLNLFADTVFPATVTRVEATRSGGYALAGHLDSHPLSTFTLVVNGDTVAGTVLTPWDRYELASPPDTPGPSTRLRTGVTAIRQVDPATLPGGCETDASSPLPVSAAAPSTTEPEEAGGADSNDPTIIDLAVFYTPATRKSWGGTALAETTIDLWVAETNKAYVDSEVNQRLRLVHRQEIDYTEAGSRNIGTELGRFETDGDGHMDEVHTIRTQVGADLLHLIIAKTSGSCGLANVWGPWGVTKYRCGSVAFAHELGHNMTLRHDWPPGQAQPNATPNATSSQASDSDYRNCEFGYVNQKAFEANAPESARWRTIMALNSQCRDHGFDCTHLMRFSNPDQTYGGDPLGRTCKEPGRGEPEPADARKEMNGTASTIAGWQATVGTPLFLRQIPNSAQTYPKAAAMPPFRLPAASAGTGALTYSLSPALPTGLTFDATTRTISGTPTTASTETTYTYTATDTSDPPDTASLTFTLTVVESVQGLCTTDDPAVGDGGSALATDCSTLLGLKDVLRGGSGSTSLNWARTRAMTAWDGLTVSAGSTARVTGLALSGWDLTGSLSTALNNLTGLTSLDLSDNQLTETIPALNSLTGLTSLNLSDNQLTGSIPALSSLTGLTSLNLSDNQLTGSIPAMTSLSSLTSLDLSDNQLTGSIPALTSLSSLTVLNLSHNQLTGRIPLQLGQPPLTTLTTFYATTNDTLCLPKALLTWHGTTLTKQDFLISCLSTLTPPYVLTFTKGEAIDRLTFNLSGNTLRLWLEETDNLPQGLTLNNTNSATIEMWGTPTELQTAATSSFRLEGNGGGGPEVSLVLTTTVEDDIPNFDDISVTAQTYTQGSAVAVTLPTASAGNRPLTYSLSPTPPAGLTFDPATRLLSGTPTTPTATTPYTYTATDATGDVTSLTFSMTVTARRTGGGGGGGGGGGQPADQHGNTPATATHIAVGSSTPGEINARTDQDYFTLTVSQPGLLVIETSGSTDTHGTLITPDGHILAQADTGGTRRNFQVTQRVTAGTYLVAVTGTRTGSYRLTVDLLVGFVDNPQPDSAQSGIGVLSGWVCEAETVEVELNGVLYQAAYGTERTDTVDQCGDTNNGFGLLYNWNKLGDGVHTVRVVVDGIEFATLPVTVTTLGLGEEFPRGLTGEAVLPDFPTDGETSRLVWQEAQQNFALADGPVTPSGTTRDWTWAVLGNPAPGSYQSGVRVISGWVCEAEEVVVEIDGEHRLVAAYGTERADTAAQCGDTNNGFGLLWNWNKLADGPHTMRLLVDGEEWATAAFTVTTLGEEFRRGLVHTGRVWDFPGAGEVVTVEWQEAQQNFVVTGVGE